MNENGNDKLILAVLQGDDYAETVAELNRNRVFCDAAQFHRRIFEKEEHHCDDRRLKGEAERSAGNPQTMRGPAEADHLPGGHSAPHRRAERHAPDSSGCGGRRSCGIRTGYSADGKILMKQACGKIPQACFNRPDRHPYGPNTSIISNTIQFI